MSIMGQDGTHLMSEDQRAIYGVLESDGHHEMRKIADIENTPKDRTSN